MSRTPEGYWRIIVPLLRGDAESFLKRLRSSGAETAQLMASGLAESRQHCQNFSRDGRYMAFYRIQEETTSRDLWVRQLDPPGEPLPLLEGPFEQTQPKISPNGSHLAYQSDDSGEWQIYVIPFPEGEGRWQVSVDGGVFTTLPRMGGDSWW